MVDSSSKEKTNKEAKKQNKPKEKVDKKSDPFKEIVAGILFVSNQLEFASNTLSRMYLQLQAIRSLLETIGPDFNRLAKGIGNIQTSAPAPTVVSAPPTIKQTLVGAARAITANMVGKVMPSILDTGDKTKVKGKAEKTKTKAKLERVERVERAEKIKNGKDSVGPLDNVVNAVKGIGAKAAQSVEKMLGGLADSVALFGEKKTVQGAKSMLMLASSLLALAGALVLFSKVKIGDFLKAIVAMTGLVAFAKYVAGMKKNILEGSKAMLILAGSLLVAALGLTLFSKVNWSAIAVAAVSMLGLVGLATLVSKMESDVRNGAFTIMLLSASLLAAALGLVLFSFVDWSSIFKAGLVLVGLAGLAVAIAKIAPEALIGAVTIGILSASLLVSALALMLFAAVDWESIAKAGVALITFAALAAGVGLVAGPIILGSIAIAALGASLLVASVGLLAFGMVDWAKVNAGISSLMLLSLAMIPIALLLPVFLSAAVGLTALGAGLIVFGAGAIVAGAGIKLLGSGFDKFADGMEKLGKIKAADLLATAGAIGVLGVAMAAFAAGNVVAGIGNLVTNLLSIGQDSPVEQLLKIGNAGEGIQKAADGMNALADAMARFGDISIDSLKALNEFPWLKATAFVAAGGVVSIRNVTVSDQTGAAQQSNMRLVTPQDTVETSNLTGATMVQYQKQTDELNAQSANTQPITIGGGGGNKASVTTNSVSNVTYNSNNIPDRTVNYLTPAYGF